MTTTADDPKGTEAAIQHAIERGDFQNLKGKGKPLDLNDYFDTPEDVRLGYTLLKNAGYVPEEVQLLNQIAELQEKIKIEKNGNNRKTLQKLLHDVQLKYNLRKDRFGKR